MLLTLMSLVGMFGQPIPPNPPTPPPPPSQEGGGAGKWLSKDRNDKDDKFKKQVEKNNEAIILIASEFILNNN